jgi:GST-like protein
LSQVRRFIFILTHYIGAILLYLAEKTGKLLPSDSVLKYQAIQWLFWQVGGAGPMFGQLNHFYGAPEEIPYAKKRFLDESKRLFAVLNKQLEGKEYIIGDDYTVADISLFAWVKAVRNKAQLKGEFDDYPNVDRWLKTVGDRPAVQRGVKVCGF